MIKYIKSLFKPKEPYERRFTRIGGFKDGTDYILVTDKGSWIVLLNGERKSADYSYTLKDCLERVADGSWEEIDYDMSPKPSTLEEMYNKEEYSISLNGNIVEVSKYAEPPEIHIINYYENPYENIRVRPYLNYILKDLGYTHFYMPKDVASIQDMRLYDQWIIKQYHKIKE